MQKPELLDVVELLVNLPEQDLSVGMRGAIVYVYNDAYEVEFVSNLGETSALLPLSIAQFVVVWRSASQQRLIKGKPAL